MQFLSPILSISDNSWQSLTRLDSHGESCPWFLVETHVSGEHGPWFLVQILLCHCEFGPWYLGEIAVCPEAVVRDYPELTTMTVASFSMSEAADVDWH